MLLLHETKYINTALPVIVCKMDESSIPLLDALKRANLTEGESKVYLALLELGSQTTGPIIEKSGVNRSIVYQILDRLIEKGIVSYITKDRTNYYQASDPQKLLEYMDQQQEQIEKNKNSLSAILPQLSVLQNSKNEVQVRVYEGFKGVQTAFNHYKNYLKQGENYYIYAISPGMEKHYDLFWRRHHEERVGLGIGSRMLFDRRTDAKILQNRNSYENSDARYMPVEVPTDSWVLVYGSVACIFLQERDLAIEIDCLEVARTFKAYFDDYWEKSTPFKAR